MPRSIRTFPLFLALVASVAGCGGSDAPSPAPTLSLLSSRSDAVSDGSALVQVTVPAGTPVANARVVVGSADVTSQLRPVDATTLVGVVSGLQPGANSIAATTGGDSATLQVTNTDRNGPIFSGPQQTPFLCQTDKIVLPDGSNLGAALDANCNAPTKVIYLYMPAGGTALKALPSTTALPADMSQTTTTDGRTVNFIVRLETGTVNRAIYQVAVLFDPAKDKVPNAGGAFTAWNGKLIYTFGGGTGPGYTQGTSTGGVTFPYMLNKGFAVASSSLNVSGNNSNDVTNAEAMSMVKEIFIKSFGVPMYTMGWGGSGGAIEQQLVANNYPGLLDGLLPTNSFPDVFTLFPPVQDCALLDRAFTASNLAWTEEQKAAVAGFASWKNCNNGVASGFASDWSNSYNFLSAYRVAHGPYPVFGTLANCSLAIADAQIYHPMSNPGGVRCGIFDGDKSLLGVDPATGYARRPWDNVGVQYGLAALTAGRISPEQFVRLNELAGGYDGDGNLQAARSVASADALRVAYAYGRVNQMGNLASVPILDFRGYGETEPNVHDFVRSFVTRARLARANGSAANQVIWVAPNFAPAPAPSTSQAVVEQVILAMDQWLTAIKKDKAAGSPAEVVVRNKPASLTDGCFDAKGQFTAEALGVENSGRCGAQFPVHADPRLVAGSPLTADVLKCQLKPLARGDYPGMTDAQFARLGAVFPQGVCDFGKPGVGAVPLVAPWLKYTAPGVATAM